MLTNTRQTPDLDPPVRRIAVISVHGCPMVVPGMRAAGGMNVSLRNIAPLLADAGVCVDVFTRSHHLGGPQAVEMSLRSRTIHIPAGDPGLTRGETYPHLPEFQEGLLRFLEEESLTYDLVHSHYWLSGEIGRSVADRLAVPHFTSFHTIAAVKERASDEPEPPQRHAAESRIARSADGIFALTEKERADIGDLLGADTERVRVVPGGVDLERFAPRDRTQARDRLGLSHHEKIVLFVGRPEPFKGPDVLVRALAYLREPSHVRLLLVGGSEIEHSVDWIYDIANQAGMRDRVQWQPAIPQADLPDFYAAADVCAVPSHHESFGLAALEAMACGRPVLASTVAGLESLIDDGRTGSLVGTHDPMDFACSLEELLNNPLRRERMGEAAHQAAATYTWEAAASRTLDGYAAVLRDAVGRAAVAPCP